MPPAAGQNGQLRRRLALPPLRLHCLPTWPRLPMICPAMCATTGWRSWRRCSRVIHARRRSRWGGQRYQNPRTAFVHTTHATHACARAHTYAHMCTHTRTHSTHPEAHVHGPRQVQPTLLHAHKQERACVLASAPKQRTPRAAAPHPSRAVCLCAPNDWLLWGQLRAPSQPSSCLPAIARRPAPPWCAALRLTATTSTLQQWAWPSASASLSSAHLSPPALTHC